MSLERNKHDETSNLAAPDPDIQRHNRGQEAAKQNHLEVGISLILSITVLATVVIGIGITPTRSAVAASALDQGPSAAADAFNNQYDFWKGTDSNLWEAYYNSYTRNWNGPIKIVGMGPLGSESSVVVGDQNFTGPGGKSFQA